MNEIIWRDVIGLEERYEVSNTGVVRSKDIYVPCRGGKSRIARGRVKPQYRNNRGYVVVTLSKDSKAINKLVHRLVAEAFIDNPYGKAQVNHKDGNIENNCADNLEWVTDDENKAYSSINNGGSQRPKRPVYIVNPKEGIFAVFPGLRDAERAFGLDHSSALQVVSGRQNQTKGFYLYYVGGDEACQN